MRRGRRPKYSAEIDKEATSERAGGGGDGEGENRGDGNGGRRWAIDSHRHFYFSCHSHCLNIQLLRRDGVGITVRAGVVPGAAGVREGQRVHPRPLPAPAGRSPRPPAEAALSLFWNNETLNIWTHLIGSLVFLGLTVANSVDVPQVADLIGLFSRSNSTSAGTNISYSKELLLGTNSLVNLNQITEEEMKVGSLQPAASWWPFFVFLGGSMFCLLSSSIFHLFSCHSYCLNIQLLRMDYVGITVMIITSFFPPIYYIFQCEPHWQLIYLGGITAMMMFTVVTLLAPSLSSGKFWAFQVMLFSSMGFFGIVPSIHACIVNWSNPQCPIMLVYESAMALSYIAGNLFYVSRIPERLKPGWFDLTGHSHQIFHVFVIMDVLAH